MPKRKGRLVVTDNFYTRHSVGEQLRRLPDSEISLLSTMRLNILNGLKRRSIEEAQALLKYTERGQWYLCTSYHTAARSFRGASAQTIIVAKNTGFFVGKDRNIITFYCNCLASTLQAPISESNERAIQCVHGLDQTRRWVGDEAMHATIANVPSVVMANNLFMN